MARHGSNEAESIVVGGSGSTAATTANNNAAAVSPAEARTQGPPATKRGRYVVRACEQCQQRKVKCTGEQPGPCQNCGNNHLSCTYKLARRKRRNIKEITDAPADPHRSTNNNTTQDTQEPTERHDTTQTALDPSMQDTLLTRLVNLENRVAQDQRDREVLLHRLTTTGSTGQASAAATSTIPSRADTNHAVAELQIPTISLCSFRDNSDLPSCCQPDLLLAGYPPVAEEVQALESRIKIYFDVVNPYYPCLNETQTLAHLRSCLANQWPLSQPTFETAQFIALVHLIDALLHVVEGQWKASSEGPGHGRMQQASHLLAHTSQIGDGDLHTVQCLIVKSLYLLHTQEYTAAYLAISEAVRTSFLLGLHTRRRDHELSPFEIHMNQRVFWSVYCLDRAISRICRVPYAIRDVDVQIDLPMAIDDKALGGSEQLPEETPTLSSIPYLCNDIAWVRMRTEVWDRESSGRHTDEDFNGTMDARLQSFEKRLPKMLRWDAQQAQISDPERPQFVAHQAMILHLRTNHLRLQLLRKELIHEHESRESDLELCLAITNDTVNVIHNFYFSDRCGASHRCPCITYLLGALKVLRSYMNDIFAANATGISSISIADNHITITEQCFRRTLEVINDCAPGFKPARSALKTLQPVLEAFPSLQGNAAYSRHMTNEATADQQMELWYGAGPQEVHDVTAWTMPMNG